MARSLHLPRSASATPSRTSSFSSKRSSFEPSRSSSNATASEREGTIDVAPDDDRTMAGRPPMTDRRDSLASLSVAHDPRSAYADEPTWPKGWRPYACLMGGFFLMFNSWGLVNAYGTYASYYMQHLMTDRKLYYFNLIGSTQSFVVLILSAVVGRFLDAGWRLTLIITGTVLVSLGSFLLSIVNGDGAKDQGNYALTWLTQGFVSSLGMACFFVTSSQVVATWFRKKKGLAIGIVASGASIAGLIYPMMFKFLILESNFRTTALAVAGVTTVTAALAIIIAKPNPEHPSREPEKWSLSVFVDRFAFKNTAYAWFCGAICWMFFGFYAVFFNLEEWAASNGLGYKDQLPGSDEDPNFGYQTMSDNAVRTFYLLAIMNATSTIGRVASAYLCDHFGALNVHAIVTFIASLLILFGWTFSTTVPAALAFVILFGIFSGAVIGLPPASVAYILGPDLEAQAKLGQWTGMMYSVSAVAALTGPVIAGYLISEYETYLTVQLWSGTCLLISAICMAIAIFYRSKELKQEQSMRQRMLSRFNSVVRGSTVDWMSRTPTTQTRDSSEVREKEMV